MYASAVSSITRILSETVSKFEEAKDFSSAREPNGQGLEQFYWDAKSWLHSP